MALTRFFAFCVFLLPQGRAAAQAWRLRADSLLSLARTETAVPRKVDLLAQASFIALFQKPDTAFAISTEAVRLAEASRSEVAQATAYTSLSAVYLIRDDNPQTLHYALKALRISERTPLPPDLLASIHRKLGYVYRNQNEDRRSIDAFKQSVAYSVQSGNRHDQAATASNLGQVFAKVQRPDSALHYHLQALAIARQDGYTDIAVRCYINIVNVHDDEENNGAAFAALYEMEPFLESDELTPIVKGLAYTTIADLDLRKGAPNHPLAAKYLPRMSALLAHTEPGTENKMDYYLSKALHEFSRRNVDSARLALVAFHRYKKIHDDELIAGHAQDLAVRYQTGKKEEQINSLAATARLRSLLLAVFVLASLLLLVLLVWIVRQNRRIKKQEAKLASLMKELHHRVKNNLQIVSSLLSLQGGQTEDAAAQKALLEGQHRVEAMSLIHRKLYQTDDVSGVNMPEFVAELAESLMLAYGFNHHRLDLALDIQVKRFDADTAIPLGLILNETVTNAFKYAYGAVQHPRMQISLTNEAQATRLLVADNGPGVESEQWRRSPSFGKSLVQSLVKQLGGSLQVQSERGSRFIFTFPQKPTA